MLVILLFSDAGSGGAFSCTSRANGIYADPANCSRFYQCYSGNLYSFTCPAGLYFDPAFNGCNWPNGIQQQYLDQCTIV